MKPLHVALALTAALTLVAGAVQAKPRHQCREIAAEAPRARALARTTNYATDGFAMRRQGGVSRCNFVFRGQGACSLSAPGLVHVTTERTNAYYDVPRGRAAMIIVEGGVARCRTD